MCDDLCAASATRLAGGLHAVRGSLSPAAVGACVDHPALASRARPPDALDCPPQLLLPPLPAQALLDCKVLDTPDELRFDAITRLLASVFKARAAGAVFSAAGCGPCPPCMALSCSQRGQLRCPACRCRSLWWGSLIRTGCGSNQSWGWRPEKASAGAFPAAKGTESQHCPGLREQASCRRDRLYVLPGVPHTGLLLCSAPAGQRLHSFCDASLCLPCPTMMVSPAHVGWQMRAWNLLFAG